MQRELDREGLADLVEVVRAPLRPHERSWPGAHLPDDRWYDEAALTAALTRAGQPVDVLVVDGPPAWRPGMEHARYPALGGLARRLAPGATIVLDDIERAGEQAVLARWRQEHGIAFDVHPAGGVAIGNWPGP